MKEANSCKQNWNANQYTQVKVAVRPQIAAAFKAACASAHVSMASELSLFMAQRGDALVERKAMDKLKTREKRRKTVDILIKQVEEIKDAEEGYKESIPENLCSSAAYDSADQCIASLEDAIEALDMAY